MSNLANKVEGDNTKRGKFPNFTFTSDTVALQKNSTLRNWFLKPTVDHHKESCANKTESGVKNVGSNDKNQKSSLEGRNSVGRKVRSFFKQTNSNKDDSMSEDEDDTSFWRKTTSKCAKKEDAHNTSDNPKENLTRKIRSSIFRGTNGGHGRDYTYEKCLSIPVDFSSEDENESQFTDANSQILKSKSLEKFSSREQCLTKSPNNKALDKESGKSSEENSYENDGDFSPATPPENVLEGPYKFVFQTPNTFTSQPHTSEDIISHKDGRYVVEYLSKRLATMNIETDFDSLKKQNVISEEEIQKLSENIIESISNELTKNKVCKWEAQKEIEKLKLENSKLIKIKQENLLQKQEIVSLKTKLESVNKRNSDLVSDMKKFRDNSTDEKMRECTFTNENENEDVTISNTGPGVLELNANNTSKKLTQSTFKPSKYLPRETRNNETRLKYLEKKVFGLEKSLEKKKKQLKTNNVRVDLNKYTINQFLDLIRNLNEVVQFYNVYGNNLKQNNDIIIKIETYCSTLNTNNRFEDNPLRLHENSFKVQLGPLFANINFSLVDQLTMNFKFYERSANFQKETICGLRTMLGDKDNYIKTLMRHLKKKEDKKSIKDSENYALTLKSQGC